MPELPEVEVVRRGLCDHVRGRSIEKVSVYHPRAVRNTPEGPHYVEHLISGRKVEDVHRRGKFLWLALDEDLPVIVHLGMSGQMLLKHGGEHKHLRIRAVLSDATELWFVDQRTFGYWRPSEYDESCVPQDLTHIAVDLLDPACDVSTVARQLKQKPLAIKKLLLDQGIVSGIGNIYADEMLWSAQIHPLTPAARIAQVRLEELLHHGQQVMQAALAQGGTSFDALYVHVNGESGYFDVSLKAYGQDGKACSRCGVTIVREQFMNRSSHYCPRCQRRR